MCAVDADEREKLAAGLYATLEEVNADLLSTCTTQMHQFLCTCGSAEAAHFARTVPAQMELFFVGESGSMSGAACRVLLKKRSDQKQSRQGLHVAPASLPCLCQACTSCQTIETKLIPWLSYNAITLTLKARPSLCVASPQQTQSPYIAASPRT